MHFCGHPDSVMGMRQGSLAQWQRGYVIKWGVSLTRLGNFSHADIVELQHDAWESWARLADVRHEYRPSNPRSWNVEIIGHQFDGPAGTLADAMLPVDPRARSNPSTLKLIMRLDTSDRWAYESGGGMVPLGPVLAHETGHLLGLGHAPRNATPDLMDPQLGTMTVPGGDWETVEIAHRYGGSNSPREPDCGRVLCDLLEVI